MASCVAGRARDGGGGGGACVAGRARDRGGDGANPTAALLTRERELGLFFEVTRGMFCFVVVFISVLSAFTTSANLRRTFREEPRQTTIHKSFAAMDHRAIEECCDLAHVPYEDARRVLDAAGRALQLRKTLQLEILGKEARRSGRTISDQPWHSMPSGLRTTREEQLLCHRGQLHEVCDALTRAEAKLRSGSLSFLSTATPQVLTRALIMLHRIPSFGRLAEIRTWGWRFAEDELAALRALVKEDQGGHARIEHVTEECMARARVSPEALVRARQQTTTFCETAHTLPGHLNPRKRRMDLRALMQKDCGLLRKPVKKSEWKLLPPAVWMQYETSMLAILNGEEA